uniref:Uncharacterized protein n=1 Tax=Arundo donax TaxID=35708 RepID=A0A0A8ZAT8_ARUDO
MTCFNPQVSEVREAAPVWSGRLVNPMPSGLGGLRRIIHEVEA